MILKRVVEQSSIGSGSSQHAYRQVGKVENDSNLLTVISTAVEAVASEGNSDRGFYSHVLPKSRATMRMSETSTLPSWFKSAIGFQFG